MQFSVSFEWFRVRIGAMSSEIHKKRSGPEWKRYQAVFLEDALTEGSKDSCKGAASTEGAWLLQNYGQRQLSTGASCN